MTDSKSAWTRDPSLKSNLYQSLGGSAISTAATIPKVGPSFDLPAEHRPDPFPGHGTSDRPIHHHSEISYDRRSEMLQNTTLPHRPGMGGPDGLRNTLNTAGQKTATNCLWLGGLDTEAHRREDLRDFFNGWQGFIDIHMPDSSGYFAFARFETAEDAVDAKNFIARKFHFVVCGKSIKVNFGRQMSTARSQSDGTQSATQAGGAHSMGADIGQGARPMGSSSIQPDAVDQEIDDDADMRETVHEFMQQEQVINPDVTYYEDSESERKLSRNEIDEIVGRVDRVRRSSGREDLRDCMKRKRTKACEVLEVIKKRIVHLYSQDVHKKLMVLYAVGDFFYCLPPHRRYDIGAMIGEDMIEFLSIIESYQCDKGKSYVSDVVASLYFYFVPAVRKKLEVFIDIELLIELKQDESTVPAEVVE